MLQRSLMVTSPKAASAASPGCNAWQGASGQPQLPKALHQRCIDNMVVSCAAWWTTLLQQYPPAHPMGVLLCKPPCQLSLLCTPSSAHPTTLQLQPSVRLQQRLLVKPLLSMLLSWQMLESAPRWVRYKVVLNVQT